MGKENKNSNNEPLISIITVVYNCEKTLENTIKSVLNQSYINIEYLIIDGNSNDGTINILKKYEDNIDFLLSEPDKGIYDAMNKGLKMAHGEYIAFLNAGDTYDSDSVQKIVSEIKNKPKPDIIYGMMRIINSEGKILWIYGYTHNFIEKSMIAHPTCFVKKELYNKFNYNTMYKSAADYDLFLTFYEKQYSFVFLEKIIGNYSLGGMSDSYKGKEETLKVLFSHKILTKKQYIIRLLILNLKKILKR